LIVLFAISIFSGAAMSQEYIVLKVIINEEDRGDFIFVKTGDKDLLIKKGDLDTFRLKEGLGRVAVFDDEEYVSLGSIHDLEFQIDEEEGVLEVFADPHLFKTQELDIFRERSDRFTPGAGSAFLNYAATYNLVNNDDFLQVSGELGSSAGDYFGSTTFTYEKNESADRIVRLFTNLTRSDREKLQAITLGDFSASSGPSGSRLNMGGVNLSKSYEIAPSFIRFPSPDLRVSVDTPSEVEIYMDDFLMRREKLQPGEFVFKDVPVTVGAGTVRIVIKDSGGGEKTIVLPYYYSNRLLRRGLHEYEYSIGYLREDFGQESFSYGRPALLAFHRLGVNKSLTAGYTAEASEDTVNLGLTASTIISSYGSLDSAVSLSKSGKASGVSGTISYSFQSRNFGAGLFLRSNSEEYSSLAIRPSDDRPKMQFGANVSFGLKKMGSISLIYSLTELYKEESTSIVSASYSRRIGKKTTFFANVLRTMGTEPDSEIFLGLHINLGKGISGNITHNKSNKMTSTKAAIQKNIPTRGGFGFRANAERIHESTNINGSIQYQNNHGFYEAGYTKTSDEQDYRLFLSGGIGYIDGSLFYSRPIRGSYAKVKVADIEGVRVLSSGSEIGRTDKKGEVIIPDIRSYTENTIGIKIKDIPINYSISTSTKSIYPPFRSGSVVTFDVYKVRGITGVVHAAEEGGEVPVESAIMLIQLEDRTVEGMVGNDGEFYIENVPGGKNSVKVIYEGKECTFDMIIPDNEDVIVDMGKVMCGVEK
jgi:outer membrane usher protein